MHCFESSWETPDCDEEDFMDWQLMREWNCQQKLNKPVIRRKPYNGQSRETRSFNGYLNCNKEWDMTRFGGMRYHNAGVGFQCWKFMTLTVEDMHRLRDQFDSCFGENIGGLLFQYVGLGWCLKRLNGVGKKRKQELTVHQKQKKRQKLFKKEIGIIKKKLIDSTLKLADLELFEIKYDILS